MLVPGTKAWVRKAPEDKTSFVMFVRTTNMLTVVIHDVTDERYYVWKIVDFAQIDKPFWVSKTLLLNLIYIKECTSTSIWNFSSKVISINLPSTTNDFNLLHVAICDFEILALLKRSIRYSTCNKYCALNLSAKKYFVEWKTNCIVCQAKIY